MERRRIETAKRFAVLTNMPHGAANVFCHFFQHSLCIALIENNALDPYFKMPDPAHVIGAARVHRLREGMPMLTFDEAHLLLVQNDWDLVRAALRYYANQ